MNSMKKKMKTRKKILLRDIGKRLNKLKRRKENFKNKEKPVSDILKKKMFRLMNNKKKHLQQINKMKKILMKLLMIYITIEVY
jgi:hypothetical protein